MRLKHNSMTTSSSFPKISEIFPAIHLKRHAQVSRRGCAGELDDTTRTYFFMTCRLTFCMSTFWENSGGNLVDFMSRASPPDAMLGHAAVAAKDGNRGEMRREQKFSALPALDRTTTTGRSATCLVDPPTGTSYQGVWLYVLCCTWGTVDVARWLRRTLAGLII